MVRVCLRVKDMGGNRLEGDRLSADVSDKFHQWNPTPRPLGGTKKDFLLLVDAKKTLARQILVKNVGAEKKKLASVLSPKFSWDRARAERAILGVFGPNRGGGGRAVRGPKSRENSRRSWPFWGAHLRAIAFPNKLPSPPPKQCQSIVLHNGCH